MKKKCKSGIKIDPLGYYNPANAGQPVIIPSNRITMKGMKSPILGISDTGDIKVMQPGKEYKFKGKSVLEMPSAQAGGTKPAKKPYNIDDEIEPVLNTVSPYDNDSTFSDVVKRAAQKAGVSAPLLFSSSLQEGLNKAALKPDEVSEAYDTASLKDKDFQNYPIDGFYNYGLDRFDEMYPELKKKGYLPADFKYKPFTTTNEKKEKTRSAAFRNNEEALVAKAAVLKNERDKVTAYLKKKNVELPEEAQDYFLLASYNGGFGNAQKMIDDFIATGGDINEFIEQGKTKQKGVHKNILPRYKRIANLSQYGLEAGGSIMKKQAGGSANREDLYTSSATLQYFKEKLNNQLRQKNPEAFDKYLTQLGALRKKGDQKAVDAFIQNNEFNDYLTPDEVKKSLGEKDYQKYLQSIGKVNQFHVDQGKQPLYGTEEGQKDINQLNYGRRFASLATTNSISISKNDNAYTREYQYNPETGEVDFTETGDPSLRPSEFKQAKPKTKDIAKSKKGGPVAQAGMTAEDMEMDRRFRAEQVNITQPISPLGDSDTNAQFAQDQLKPLAQPAVAPVVTPANRVQNKKPKQPYSGVNPFIATLTGISAILGPEPTPRQYTRPEDETYYNPYPSGTGSQAIMQYGGMMPQYNLNVHNPTAKDSAEYRAAFNMSSKDRKTAMQRMPYESISNSSPEWNRFYAVRHAALKDRASQEVGPRPVSQDPFLNSLQHFPSKKQGGKMTPYNQGGELQTFGKGKARPLSSNFTTGGGMMQFDGPSHEEGGIPITYQGAPVEVEGDETAFKDIEGNLQILGNMKNPKTGRLFKNDGKKVAEMENKADKQMSKALELVDKSDPTDPFERLTFNTGKIKLEGAKAKMDKATMIKEDLATTQLQMLNIAAMAGKDPIKMSKAKNGAKIMAQSGTYLPPHVQYNPMVLKNVDVQGKLPVAPLPPAPVTPPVTPLAPRPATVSNTRRGVSRSVTPAGPVAPVPNQELTPLPPAPPMQSVTPLAPPDLSMSRAVAPSAKIQAPSNVKAPSYQLRVPEDKEIESDAVGMDPRNIYPELYSIATNRVQPVQMQRYNPLLEQAYNYSFQDQINQNTSSFNAAAQSLGGNAEALSVLAAQKYQADSNVGAQEFRVNQEQSAGVYNRNRNTLNEAQRFNLGLQDQQYVRQEQARTNTRRQTFDTLSSIASKSLQHTADMNKLRTYENLYDYRYDNDYRVGYEGPDAYFQIPQVAGINPQTGQPYLPTQPEYYRNSQVQSVKGPNGVTTTTEKTRQNSPIGRRRKAGGFAKAFKDYIS